MVSRNFDNLKNGAIADIYGIFNRLNISKWCSKRVDGKSHDETVPNRNTTLINVTLFGIFLAITVIYIGILQHKMISQYPNVDDIPPFIRV